MRIRLTRWFMASGLALGLAGSAAADDPAPAAAVATEAPAAPAPEPTLENRLISSFRWHAFAGWAVGGTNHQNDYAVGTPDRNYNNFSGGLLFGVEPLDRVTVEGQLFADPGGSEIVNVDWLFVDWDISDYLHIRAGKIRLPYGLFSEYLDVGTQRAFFTLPTSVYDSQDVTAEEYKGVGGYGRAHLGESGYALDYDMYWGGASLAGTTPDPIALFGFSQDGNSLLSDTIGGRLRLETPLEGLTIGFSGLTGKDQAGGDRVGLFGPQFEYRAESWLFRTEYVHSDGNTHRDSLYAEGTYRFWGPLELAGRFEWAKLNFDGASGAGVPTNLMRHQEFAVGLNYWVRPQWVWRVSFHHVIGNLYAFNPDVTTPAQAQDMSPTTNLVIFGTQFSY
jgi:hypothetical protein